MMKWQTLQHHLDEYLQLQVWQKIDVSENGLQIQPRFAQVQKIALAVDANLLTAKLAVQAQADLLIVHHGLFWHDSQPLVGLAYQRLAYFLQHGLGLYACHLPLDAHQVLGHNTLLAQKLCLQEIRALDIGVMGKLPQPLKLTEIKQLLQVPAKQPTLELLFNQQLITKVGIISGAAGKLTYLQQAKDAGVDLFITGEVGHVGWQIARDLKLNLLCLGHYWTETFGVKALGDYLQKKFSLPTKFISANTYL